jgi:ribosomal protein S24E
MAILIFSLWVIATLVFLIKHENNQRLINKRIKRINRLIRNLRHEYEQAEINNLLKSAGSPINLFNFQVIRYSLLLLIVIMLIINLIKGGEPKLIQFVISFVFFIATTPKTSILNFPSPFQMLITLLLSQKREKYNQELYMAISQLKSTFLIKQNRPPSSDYILDHIRKYSVSTREIFNHMLSLWMVNEKEQAVQYFEKAIGTKEAERLGHIFLKIDDLNPIEMKSQLEAYQEIYRTEKETKKLKINEHKSNILFLLVIASCLMIMMNFLMVVFFIDFLKDMDTIIQ